MNAAATFHACLDLCRVGNLPTVWSNVVAATLISGGEGEPVALLTASASLSFFYLAGMGLNDLCDREHDLTHRPSRPIPAGRVGVPQAGGLVALLFAAAFLLLAHVPFPDAALAGAVLLLAAIIWYDLDHKENRYSVLLMAMCRFLLFAVASLAATGGLNAPVIRAGLVQFCYVLLLSLVARYENGRRQPFTFPVIPVLLAGICLLDGAMLAVWVDPSFLWLGFAGFLLTRAGQRYVRGD